MSARQQRILGFANEQRQVQVDPLAAALDVTPQTIRRDLNLLCELRLLRRIHGGAIANDGAANFGYATRRQLASDGKRHIGARAAAIVANDSSLSLNIGTTIEQVAVHLVHHAGLLVISNNINVVTMLRDCENIQLMTAGGLVRREDGGIVGAETVRFFGQFKVDYAVIGISAIEADGTLLDFDAREVIVTRAIIENARSVILVADSMKFQRTAPVRVGNISSVSYFVTDQVPPAEFAECCARHQVEVIVAGETATT